MQESRLFRILYYLLDKGRATAPELAEKFEVSVRTIYRDVDVMSSAGIPIYVTTGRNGGIQFLDDYVLDKSFFSDSEKLEILSGLQSLSAVQYPEVDTILKKIGAVFQTRLTDWIDVDFSRWGSVAENENRLFRLLKQTSLDKGIQEKEAKKVLPTLHKTPPNGTIGGVFVCGGKSLNPGPPGYAAPIVIRRYLQAWQTKPRPTSRRKHRAALPLPRRSRRNRR